MYFKGDYKKYFKVEFKGEYSFLTYSKFKSHFRFLFDVELMYKSSLLIYIRYIIVASGKVHNLIGLT